MKKKTFTRFGLFLLAVVIGSVASVITHQLWNLDDTPEFTISHIGSPATVGGTYTVNSEGEIVPLDFTSVAKKVMPAVVHIKSTQIRQVGSSRYRNPREEYSDDDVYRYFFGPRSSPSPRARVGTGSGVIINANGYIVTNNHVIEDADDVEITLNDNRVFKAKIVGTDPSTDLALLQIRGTDLPYISFVNSDEVEIGEWVLAVGNPFNLNSTVTAGIVSAKGRNINILNDQYAIESFIQTDAAINQGNSGGALVDLTGGLVGINTALASPTGIYTGYGFAIPSNIVAKIVADLQEYGMVQRGYLGVMIRSVDGNLAKEKDLNVVEGVYVDSVTENSAAEAAGVLSGDVIIQIDETTIKHVSQLLETIGRHHPGDKVELKVDRRGTEKTFSVVLRNKEGKENFSQVATEDVLDVLGIELDEVDAKMAKRLGISGGLQVVSLSEGKISKHTNMQKGFVITKIDDITVDDKDDFVQYLNNKKGSGVMVEGVYEDYPGVYYYAFGI